MCAWGAGTVFAPVARRGMNQNNDTRWYFPAERLDAYRVARELVTAVARVSKGWRGELRAQALDAAQSAMLNNAEGAAQHSRAVKRRHFEIALGSAGETFAALDVAAALGLDGASAMPLARQLGALIGGLIRACG
jgi:four helix bundle protein